MLASIKCETDFYTCPSSSSSLPYSSALSLGSSCAMISLQRIITKHGSMRAFLWGMAHWEPVYSVASHMRVSSSMRSHSGLEVLRHNVRTIKEEISQKRERMVLHCAAFRSFTNRGRVRKPALSATNSQGSQMMQGHEAMATTSAMGI